jgi:hypothetical protein
MAAHAGREPERRHDPDRRESLYMHLAFSPMDETNNAAARTLAS